MARVEDWRRRLAKATWWERRRMRDARLRSFGGEFALVRPTPALVGVKVEKAAVGPLAEVLRPGIVPALVPDVVRRCSEPW